jgi:hypothetical protein
MNKTVGEILFALLAFVTTVAFIWFMVAFIMWCFN